MDHPLRVTGAINISTSSSGRDGAVACHVRVLHGIDVDRSAECMLRPGTRSRNSPAIECRRVVRPHRPLVATSVTVYKQHPTDLEASPIHRAQSVHEGRDRILVRNQLPDSAVSVEVVVADADESKAPDGNRATPMPRLARHAPLEPGRDPGHAYVKAARRLRGRSSGPQNRYREEGRQDD
jgi:hypothetical protein